MDEHLLRASCTEAREASSTEGGRPDAMFADRLATIHRSALRIFDACDSGHVDNPDTMFRDVEKSSAATIAS